MLVRRILPTLAAVAMIPASAIAGDQKPTRCRAASEGMDISAPGDVRVHVRTIGKGRPILFIPSLARGVADFDDVATALSKRGYLAILPDPRGTGKTQGPAPASLFDLASDAQAAVTGLCDGPVDVVGHAFGNRVARSLATSSPASVRSVVLLAGGGRAKPLAQVGDSIAVSAAQGVRSDAERREALSIAFFAKGHDPSVWLTGWFAQAKAYQNAAMQGSSVDQWWLGGKAPILLVQADEDPVAPPGNVEQLRQDIGERLRTVTLHRASHAILPEQPEAVAWALDRYFSGEQDEAVLQQGVDARTRP